jgi:hypothetical protein
MRGKKGLDIRKINSSTMPSKKWCLVVGAGVSDPLFPSWNQLIRELYLGTFKTDDVSDINKIIETYSSDSIIQSLKNFSQLSDNDFVHLLSRGLYDRLWRELGRRDKTSVFKVLSNPTPSAFTDKTWETFYRTMKEAYRNETFFQLSEVLFQAYKKNLMPSSVLSFNAESLLCTMLTSMIREHYSRAGKKIEKRRQRFDIISRSIGSQAKGRIPFYHIHGFLPVPYVYKGFKKSIISADKLIFSENEYLSLANTNYNWQASTFLQAENSNVLVFVGVSFTDINIRKWLSWTYSNRLSEIQHINKHFKGEVSPAKHFWIKRRPLTQNQESLLENLVSHLGVRIIWIDDFKQIKEVLERLLGL